MSAHTRLLRASALLLLAAAAACTKQSLSDGGTASRASAPSPRNRDLLTASDISSSGETNLFDVVRAMRPNWLNHRDSRYETIIYMDLARLGGPEAMRTIPSNSVSTMRFLDANAANARFGTTPGHPNGAIVLTSANGRTRLR